MSKSAIYVANTGSQVVPVDGTINLGGVVRRFGCGIQLSGSNITISEAGYYDVSVSITAAPTAADTVTATLLNNGVAVPGATSSATAAAAGDPVPLSFESVVRVFCGATTGSLSIVLTGGDATITNVAVVVSKM